MTSIESFLAGEPLQYRSPRGATYVAVLNVDGRVELSRDGERIGTVPTPVDDDAAAARVYHALIQGGSDA